MTLLAAVVVVAGTALGTALVLPAARRTGLGIWHPAVAWVALEAVFFGLGSLALAVIGGRPDPALFVGAAVAAFGLGVAAADRLARRRGARPPDDSTAALGQRLEPDPIRPVAVIVLAALGVVALLPTLLDVGIPFLAGDVTGARSEVGGLDLQVLRVALPAAVVVALLAGIRAGSGRTRLLAGMAFGAAVVAEVALASRYLSAELVAAAILALGIGRRPIPVRTLALVGVAALALFVSIGILRAWDQAAGREVDFAVQRTVNRVILIEPRTLDALQTAIPAEQPFFGGLTWLRRLAPLVGRDDVPNLGYWIYPRLFPDQVIPGYAAPGLIGEAWANLGWTRAGAVRRARRARGAARGADGEPTAGDRRHRGRGPPQPVRRPDPRARPERAGGRRPPHRRVALVRRAARRPARGPASGDRLASLTGSRRDGSSGAATIVTARRTIRRSGRANRSGPASPRASAPSAGSPESGS